MKKYLFLALRIGTALAGLGYILYVMNWSDTFDEQGVVSPGVISTLRDANWMLLLLALVMMGFVYPIFSTRWWMLMRVRNIPCSLYKAFRLAMVGCFFNYCMPGTTGGDILRAYYAAKGSDRKADAVISVVVDRIPGLMGLFIVAGVTGLFMLHEPTVRYVTGMIWMMAAVGVVGASVYFSGRLRKMLRLDVLITKLPGGSLIAKVDEAAVAYRGHIGALFLGLAMSTLLHLILTGATIIAGIALGVTQPIGLMFNVIPVLFLGAAVPISYQGLGIMEAIGEQLLVNPPACTFNQLVGLLMLARMFQVFYSLIGALFLLKGDIHLHPSPEAPEAP
ncbi:MAG: flippase-like domain-containing protein, partial [Phycisphaeraceae bacterium]|nr:flippase-like domain-containing protein [Phycisphaeraceae bacterium]